MVIVGDVAGRGAPAAALTALARHTLRTAGRLLDDPAGALAELNQELYARGSGALCTLVCALLPEDPADRTVEVLCAGHPQPVLVRDGAARQVGRFGTIVGAFADATWTSDRVEVVPGDTLVLYTDGVIGAEVADEGPGFGIELRERGPDEVGGRGLWLVSRLTRRWGVHDGISHVWFELDAHGLEEACAAEPERGEVRRPLR